MKPPRLPLRVLLVEDSPDDADLILFELNEGGFDVACARVETGAAMRAALAEGGYDVVISDFNLPRFSTREALALLREVDADIPFIIVSGCIGEESAIALMKDGVSDFVMKDRLARLVPAIERELQDATVRREHRRAQEALREREQEFRAMVENSPDIIARYDSRFRRIYVNPAMQVHFGLSVEAILGKTPEDFSPLPEVQGYMRHIKSVFETGREELMEFSWTNKQSGTRWGHMRLAPEFSADGTVVSVLAITRDITERKSAEDALAIRERKFRTLAENLPDNIVRYDLQARKIFVNLPTVRTLGISSDVLIGMAPVESSSESILAIDEYDTKLRRVLESGEPDEFEMAVRHAEEGAQIHNVRFVAERDTQGQIVGALAIGRDMSAQKSAEAALLEREQRYRGIFDNVLDSLFLLEVTHDGRFRNLEVNPAFEKSSGIPSAALVGKFIEETVPDETAQLVIAKYRRCVEAGTITDEEITLELPGGIRHYHSSLIPVRDDSGRIHRIIGISRDITGRKQSERDLLRSRTELRDLTAYLQTVREEERTHLARELHDELGQMLAGVKFDAKWLASHLSGAQHDVMDKLASMSELIDQTLDSIRRVAADLRPVMLDDLGLMAAVEWLAEDFGKRFGIAVQFEREVGQLQHGCGGNCDNPTCGLDPSVATAAYRIVQECLTNVARHAQATHVQVFLKCRDGKLKIWVSDNGMGIAENHERKHNSYGIIGMQERAHSLGGTLEFSSAPEKGTSVKVVLPIKTVSYAGGTQ